MTAPATPTKQEELIEGLLDPKKLAALSGGDGQLDPAKLREFVQNYATSVMEHNSFKAEMVDAMKEGLKAFGEANNIAMRRIPMGESGVAGDLHNIYAPLNLTKIEARQIAATGQGVGMELDNMPLGEFARAAWYRHGPEGMDHKLIKNAASSLVGADGGFLIPEMLRAELLRISLEQAIVRSRARIIPMESLTVPFPTIVDGSHASSVFGGIIGYWTQEGAALTESKASFGRMVLEARKLTGYVEVPNELVADAVLSFEAFINAAYPEAIAWFEDLAFLQGTGVGEPLGVHGSPAVVAVGAEAGQATKTLVWENIVKMFARMLPGSLNRAVWVAQIDTFPELATMALSVGTGGAPVWLSNGQAGPPMTILGRPVIFTEKMQTLGTQGDLAFVDFGYYLIGDRQAMSMASSPHYKFANDLTAYRFIERVDGRPWLQTALTPHAGTNTLSAFVELATR